MCAANAVVTRDPPAGASSTSRRRRAGSTGLWLAMASDPEAARAGSAAACLPSLWPELTNSTLDLILLRKA